MKLLVEVGRPLLGMLILVVLIPLVAVGCLFYEAGVILYEMGDQVADEVFGKRKKP